jgi:hypothetical protein
MPHVRHISSVGTLTRPLPLRVPYVCKQSFSSGGDIPNITRTELEVWGNLALIRIRSVIAFVFAQEAMQDGSVVVIDVRGPEEVRISA